MEHPLQDKTENVRIRKLTQTCQLVLESLQLLRSRRVLLLLAQWTVDLKALVISTVFFFLPGHLTDSECNQRHVSKKSSLADRKRSSSRSRRKGDEAQSSGYHSEGRRCYILLNISIFLNVFNVLSVYIHFPHCFFHLCLYLVLSAFWCLVLFWLVGLFVWEVLVFLL